jgi:hypothetical protein
MRRTDFNRTCSKIHARQCAFAAAFAFLVGSVSALGAEALTCTTPQRAMLEVELMFGRNIGGRLGVGTAAWSRFLAGEVTRRFPDGLTVIDAAGQWRDREHTRMVREPSKLVIIVTADDAGSRDKIAAIVAAYKQQFHQQSVGVVTRPVCAVF